MKPWAKISILLGILLALAPAAGQGQANAGNRAPRGNLVLYREEPCAASSENEVVVCRRRLTAEGLVALHDVAACLVARRPRAVRALLAMAPDSAGYREAMQHLVDHPRRCVLDRRLGFSSLLFAGALAEAMLDREPWPDRLADRLRTDPRRPLRARDEAEYMSLCVAGALPAAVAALLATRPATTEEAAALDAVAPRLQPCLAAGLSASFNRAALRAHLALAALRLSRHNGRW